MESQKRISWAAVHRDVKGRRNLGIALGFTPEKASLVALEGAEKEFDIDLSFIKDFMKNN